MEGNAGTYPEPKDGYTVFRSTEDPIEFRVVPSCDYALKGVLSTLEVLLQIKTGAVEEEEGSKASKRSPIDLAIVLDRSGSMRGEKLRFSKIAVKQVIQNLTPEDKLHFVVYDNKATVVFENGDLHSKDDLEKQVEAITHGGSTNLEKGLSLGAELLQKYKEPGRTQRIYLFSDGLANCGKTKHEELFQLTSEIHEKKITTMTFGIGEDFDEDLMKGIAEYGNSYYFYIETTEQIERFVGAALGALLGVLGNDAVLKVRGKNGGIVKKIHGHSDLVKGVVIGDIKQSNLKSILVQLDYTPNAKEEEEEALTWELTYKRTKDDKKEVTVTGALKIRNTENEDLVQCKNSEVAVTSLIHQSAEYDSEVLKLLDNGKRKEALELKKKEVALLKEQVSIDKTGRIESLLVKAEKFVKDLEDTQVSEKHLKKASKWHRNLKRNDSADWTALM